MNHEQKTYAKLEKLKKTLCQDVVTLINKQSDSGWDRKTDKVFEEVREALYEEARDAVLDTILEDCWPSEVAEAVRQLDKRTGDQDIVNITILHLFHELVYQGRITAWSFLLHRNTEEDAEEQLDAPDPPLSTYTEDEEFTDIGAGECEAREVECKIGPLSVTFIAQQRRKRKSHREPTPAQEAAKRAKAQKAHEAAMVKILGPDPRISFPVLRDLVTGATKRIELENADFSWWAEGEGKCDCQRAQLMKKYEDRKPLLSHDLCLGFTRFVAVDVQGYFGSRTKAEILAAMNKQYPPGSWEIAEAET